MKKIILTTLSITLCLLTVISAKCAENKLNCFHPGKVWKDTNGVAINAHGGGLLFHNDTYYWYGEHKTEGRAGNKAQVGVHCYSSKDLYNWKDEGIALPVSNKKGHDIEKGCILERPKVIYNKKTNKFAMWFHLEPKGAGYSGARSGIAVADKATGPFTFIRSCRPNAGHWPVNVTPEQKKIPTKSDLEGIKFSGAPQLETGQNNILGRDFEKGQMARDMTLFVDDDGSAYHLYSSEENSTLHISKLTDDYLNYSGTYVRIFPCRWMEAPTICKRNGRYYLIASGCTGWAPNAARSAVADHIFGPWVECGNPITGTNPNNGLGPELTYGGQSTYILKVQGKKDAYIAMFDIWKPDNAIDGIYVWLPIVFEKSKFKQGWSRYCEVQWQDKWDLSVFE